MFNHPDILGFHGEFRFLSNFWPAKVILGGIWFPTVEHAYVAAKTLDLHKREFISTIDTAGQVKRFGRTLVLRTDWEEIKLDVMLGLLQQKFEEDPLKQKLLNTGNAYLEETNTWNDVYWGICHGSGWNHLGKLLMQVRKELQISE